MMKSAPTGGTQEEVGVRIHQGGLAGFVGGADAPRVIVGVIWLVAIVGRSVHLQVVKRTELVAGRAGAREPYGQSWTRNAASGSYGRFSC